MNKHTHTHTLYTLIDYTVLRSKTVCEDVRTVNAIRLEEEPRRLVNENSGRHYF
jgi:hypothetical protein